MAGRRIITYSNVTATVALVLALGGGAVYAADKIGSKDIKANAILSRHIASDQVRGSDVREKSLGLVPLAASATSVNGIDETDVRKSVPSGAGPTPVGTFAGLDVTLSCPGGDTTLSLAGAAASDRGFYAGIRGDDTVSSGEFVGTASTAAATGAADDFSGSATLKRSTGRVSRFDFQLSDVTNGFGTANDCFLDAFVRTAR